MRINCSRCRTAEYTVTLTAVDPASVDLEPGALCATTSFVDCLLVKVVVEPGDMLLAATAARILQRVATETSAAITVIDGFARRTKASGITRDYRRCPAADTVEVLTELAERLEERGNFVHLVPSGWNKSWEAEPFEYAGAQRVVDLTVGDEPVIWSAADISGWSSRCGRLFRP